MVTQVIHQDSSEAEVVKEPALIGSGNVDAAASDASQSTAPSVAEQSDQKTDASDKRPQTSPQGSRWKKKRQNRGKKKR